MDSAQPVKDSRPAGLDPQAVAARLAAAARAAGCDVETFGAAAGSPLLAMTKRTPGPRPRIYLSAGIHGDEPAGPLALLELLEAGSFDHRADWFICPLLNPAGFLAQRPGKMPPASTSTATTGTRSRRKSPRISPGSSASPIST